ncbi:hypothetical protein [Marinobacter litoralis]|uniref:hypothetical protein n=1 Tax=Marinobacter litoralis TaxID=187981 RepID=UPI0018EC64F2|nr:hypothetical protein [Marinobacter litoralis]MBJ6138448.1 hypothetical protein [Marinobacter litoralis]
MASEISVSAPTAPAQKDPELAARSRDKIAHLQSLMSAVDAPTKQPQQVESPEPARAHVTPVDELGPAEEVPAEEKEREVVPSQLPDPVPRVFVEAWQGNRFLLVGEMSEDTSLSLQQTLAVNILKSLGESSPAGLGALQWPLFNNLKVSINRIEHLLEAISASYGNAEARQIIVLGSDGELLERAFEKPVAVRFSGSLAKLAADPQLKRQLWQELKPLASL